MSDSTIARRYAGALYEEADKSGALDAVDDDIAMIRESLAGAPELDRFFASPIISRDKKSSSVKALFDGRVQPITLNFLLLMIGKGREQLFPGVIVAYQSLRDSQRDIVAVTARVARSVDEEERASLVSTIESRIGKSVRLDIEVDPGLLGGIVVQIGDTVYDGSFANQLKTLRERLDEGGYAVH